MAVVRLQEQQRPQINYGQLGGLVAQGLNPQAAMMQKLAPVLMAEEFKSKLAQKRTEAFLDRAERSGNGPLGNYKWKIGADGSVSYEQKSEKEKAEDLIYKKRMEDASGMIPSGVPQVGGQRTQRNLEPTEFDVLGPTKWAPKKGLPAESAGKLTMIQQALSDLETVEKGLFKGDEFKRGLAFRANVPGGQAPFIGRVIPDTLGGRGTNIGSAMNNALEAKLRIETGAAATQEEFNRIRDRFAITSFDTGSSARNKIRRLKDFMKNAAITVDPTGKFIYQTGDEKMDMELNLDIPEGWEIVNE